MRKTDIWHLAQTWVNSHPILIWCIATPFYRYMNCSSQDLESESLLTAYQVMVSLIAADKDLELMSHYFRVVFRVRCIRMTFGVQLTDIEPEQIHKVSGEKKQEELDEDVIDQALMALTSRQREISRWILTQPTPVSVESVGKAFGLKKRTIQAILNRAVRRIEDGHHKVCNAVCTAS